MKIELRIVEFGKNRQFEYRYQLPSVDASGAFCPPGVWSDWQVAPVIDGNDAAYEDLRVTGGIVGAP